MWKAGVTRARLHLAFPHVESWKTGKTDPVGLPVLIFRRSNFPDFHIWKETWHEPASISRFLMWKAGKREKQTRWGWPS